MEFKKVSIGKCQYGLDEGLHAKSSDRDSDLDRDLDREDVDDEEKRQLLFERSRTDSHSSLMPIKGDIEYYNFYDPKFDDHLSNPAHPNHKNIVNFFTHMALCHTVVV